MTHRELARAILPLTLIAIGTLLLLTNLGVIADLHLKAWWPALLVLAGLRILLWPRRDRACRRDQWTDTPQAR